MGKALDLTNQRFGRLVALYATDKRDNSGSVYWHCKCDCGNEVDVRACELKRGNVKSCGCWQKEARHLHPTPMLDLTGQKFGKLTPLFPTDKREEASVIWHCKCDCGNECDVSCRNLVNHKVSSCGCIKSRGEEKIAALLRENNIMFEQQKTFDTCRFSDTGRLAFFDFYLPDFNILIEYDGIQHFSYRENIHSWNNEENFDRTVERDQYKNDWCKENNITLIRIPYTHLKDIQIEDLLQDSAFRLEVA